MKADIYVLYVYSDTNIFGLANLKSGSDEASIEGAGVTHLYQRIIRGMGYHIKLNVLFSSQNRVGVRNLTNYLILTVYLSILC